MALFPLMALGPTKRIVLEHRTGSHAGLSQIAGTEDQLREKCATAGLPPFLGAVQFLDHVGACSLVRVTPRMVIYREIVAPATMTYATMDPAQR